MSFLIKTLIILLKILGYTSPILYSIFIWESLVGLPTDWGVLIHWTGVEKGWYQDNIEYAVLIAFTYLFIQGAFATWLKPDIKREKIDACISYTPFVAIMISGVILSEINFMITLMALPVIYDLTINNTLFDRAQRESPREELSE